MIATEQLGPDMRADFLFGTITFTAYCHKVWYTWKLELTRSKYFIWWWNIFSSTSNMSVTSEISILSLFDILKFTAPNGFKILGTCPQTPWLCRVLQQSTEMIQVLCLSHFSFHITVLPGQVVQVEHCAILKNSYKGGANLPWDSMWGYSITSIWKGILVSD